MVKATRIPPNASINSWEDVRRNFLKAVHYLQRPAVEGLLQRPRHGGKGLRMWLQNLEMRGDFFPEELPPALVQIYLDDSEVLPLHDCESCGLLIPVHPSIDFEAEPRKTFFPKCPHCGNRTGRHAHGARLGMRKMSAEGATSPAIN